MRAFGGFYTHQTKKLGKERIIYKMKREVNIVERTVFEPYATHIATSGGR